jgi:uncharacterized protein (DUF2336 family)
VFRSGFASSSSYRAAAKADRLLRAAVTAFCDNARPTRRDAAQLDDLAVPLLSAASGETLRFVAAALSESPHAPPALIRRLADLPVEISAPLLLRSPVLTPIDLLALVARHGASHARVIAGRDGLDERILLLIRSLDVATETAKPSKIEETRQSLRAMMRPAGSEAQAARPQHDPATSYPRLRAAALDETPGAFRDALAATLAIAPDMAGAIAGDRDPARLILALRALGLSAEEAFLVMQCLRPVRERREVAKFLAAWEAVAQDDAARVAAEWRRPSGAPAPMPKAS